MSDKTGLTIKDKIKMTALLVMLAAYIAAYVADFINIMFLYKEGEEIQCILC